MLSQRHSLSFVGFGKSAFVPDAHGTVLDDVLALSGGPQFRGCRSFALRHNSHYRKKLQIKNPQKNPSKIASSIDSLSGFISSIAASYSFRQSICGTAALILKNAEY